MICKNILTSYQLENYNCSRFLKFIYTHPLYWILWWDRQKIVWTKKAIMIAVLTMSMLISTIIWFIYFINVSVYIDMLVTIWLIILLPFYMIIAGFILTPIDLYLKNKIIKKAKEKLDWIRNRRYLKVIWITWSYWKTSQKEILENVLKENFKVITSSGNKNTPLWISELILNEMDESYDIFIVEMWAYKPGDIKELCDLVKPEIGILTWITIQHLDRFKTLENIINTKFEIIESLSENWLAVLDISNENVKSWFDSRKDKLKVKNIVKINNPESITYLPNLAWISFNHDWNTIETKLLAAHSANQVMIAYEIAKNLETPIEKILRWTRNISYVKHRLELIYNPNSNLYIIDDSFNGNFEGVKSTIELLKNTIWHRKLYLTPGLVELGKESFNIHHQIWKMLSPVVDKVLLIDNPATKSIYNWLVKSWFDANNIIVYKSTNEAHEDLKNILVSEDVIVFQNDWSDNYF